MSRASKEIKRASLTLDERQSHLNGKRGPIMHDGRRHSRPSAESSPVDQRSLPASATGSLRVQGGTANFPRSAETSDIESEGEDVFASTFSTPRDFSENSDWEEEAKRRVSMFGNDPGHAV